MDDETMFQWDGANYDVLEDDMPRSIQRRFEAFHDAHPQVYAGLVILARQGDRAGRTKIGMKMLFEVLRWEWVIAGLPDDAEEWKLNNNYTSRYARLIMEQEPDLVGIFETRELLAP
jgi:hypothetical protein